MAILSTLFGAVRNIFDGNDVARVLTILGFPVDVQQSFADAVRKYQQFHGLEPTGVVDGAVIRSLIAPRLCGKPDVDALTAKRPADLLFWRKNTLTWHIVPQAKFGLIPRDRVIEVFQGAWDRCCKVIQLDHAFTADAKTADVLIRTRPIDGSWGVLALSEYPDPDNPVQRKQDFDSEEPFQAPAVNRWHIDLNAVALHEVGHVLGIPHLPAGHVMSAAYDATKTELTPEDIAELLARYPARTR